MITVPYDVYFERAAPRVAEALAEPVTRIAVFAISGGGGWIEPWINRPSLFRRCAAPAILLPCFPSKLWRQ